MKLGAGMVLLVALVAGPLFATQLPVEDFARSPEFHGLKLSPDGKSVAFIRKQDGRYSLCFMDLATRKIVRTEPPELVGQLRREIRSFRWMNDDRVLAHTSFGISAVNRDGTQWVGLTGYDRADFLDRDIVNAYQVLHVFPPPHRKLLLPEFFRRGPYPDVIQMDAYSGYYDVVVKNPGDAVAWVPDWEGNVRLGIAQKGVKTTLLQRAEADGMWTPIAEFEAEAESIAPRGFDAENRLLYISKLGPDQKWALYSYDLQEKRLSEPLFRHQACDVAPPERSPTYAGIDLADVYFSETQRALLGVRYVTDGPKQHWFDPTYAQIQAKLDAALPGLVNMIINATAKEDKCVVLSWSCREPGFYSIFDLKTGNLTRFAKLMHWIKAEDMATMYPIRCRARDGLELHGYLTLPPQGPKKNLPLVMMPHGGPWVRDVWEFDPLVQFLANRGYAVLQINYRGSPGYGHDFFVKGKREIGGAIQTDIDDAVRWTIEKGFADPARVAILGSSYGGYSTLFALGKTPELYRCGVAIAAVSAWLPLFKDRDTAAARIAYDYWKDRIGDPKTEEDRRRLEAVSPLTFANQIQAPLLIVHGKRDVTVPISQADKMAAALAKAGRKPQTLYFNDEAHGIDKNENRIEMFKAIEAFLAKHLGAGS